MKIAQNKTKRLDRNCSNNNKTKNNNEKHGNSNKIWLFQLTKGVLNNIKPVQLGLVYVLIYLIVIESFHVLFCFTDILLIFFDELMPCPSM